MGVASPVTASLGRTMSMAPTCLRCFSAHGWLAPGFDSNDSAFCCGRSVLQTAAQLRIISGLRYFAPVEYRCTGHQAGRLFAAFRCRHYGLAAPCAYAVSEMQRMIANETQCRCHSCLATGAGTGHCVDAMIGVSPVLFCHYTRTD